MSYVLDAGRSDHGLDALAKRYFDHTTHRLQRGHRHRENPGSAFDRVDVDKAAEYAAEDADVTLRLWQVLKPRLAGEHVTSVYETLERPLVPVLARMERRGISIDRQVLSQLSGEFAPEGRLRSRPKSKSSPASRSIRAAQAARRHPVRQAGPARRNQDQDRRLVDRRARARRAGRAGPRAAAQESSTGGRSRSCARPIPMRCRTTSIRDAARAHELRAGRRPPPAGSPPPSRTCRTSRSAPRKAARSARAFIAADGHKLVSADYSQIELRLLAEIADIPALQQGVRERPRHPRHDGVGDVRRAGRRACRAEVRRRAKAINFGIIYGISAFGLANQLGIEREEAGAYIRKYFERFPGIRDYMEETKAFAKKNGYVLTLFGRKCHYPDIVNSNPSIRAFNERAAINARLQGTAADIIRRAMVRMDAALAKRSSRRDAAAGARRAGLRGARGEVEATLPVVKKVMEEAPMPAVSLSVPLASTRAPPTIGTRRIRRPHAEEHRATGAMRLEASVFRDAPFGALLRTRLVEQAGLNNENMRRVKKPPLRFSSPASAPVASCSASFPKEAEATAPSRASPGANVCREQWQKRVWPYQHRSACLQCIRVLRERGGENRGAGPTRARRRSRASPSSA